MTQKEQTSHAKLLESVYEAAKDCERKGPGYSQQRAVLQEVARKFRLSDFDALDLELAQSILTCWHDLFRLGRLSWGYDLDNPDAPFFHIPNRDDGPKR